MKTLFDHPSVRTIVGLKHAAAAGMLHIRVVKNMTVMEAKLDAAEHELKADRSEMKADRSEVKATQSELEVNTCYCVALVCFTPDFLLPQTD
jgi:hypothetical protein